MRKLILIVLVLLGFRVSARAQVTVKGVVKDALGPVVGATVLESGTANGTETGLDGDFLLVASSPGARIEVRCMGYATQVFPASAVPAVIVLADDTTFLEEVVVVGYGTQKAKDLTAPIATVKGEELARQTAANPMSALQGMVSGVQITQSGAPGAGPSVKIRGVGSIGDYANPLYVVDGVFVDNIDFLSGNDIESLTVLKDASAAAIYGVRAANGVVLVTTRKGALGRVNVAYEGYAGVQVPTHILKLANAAQYVELMNEANANTIGYQPLKAEDYTADTDWYATLVRPALTHSHALDLSGATEKTHYSVGLSYFYQDGIMNYCRNDYNRLNFRTRLDQQVTTWLKLGTSNVLSRYKQFHYNGNAYFQAFVNPPVYPVYDPANTAAYPEPFDSPQRYGFPLSYGNPVANAFYYRNTGEGLKDVFSLYAEFLLVPDKLRFKTSYNLDFDFYDNQSYTPEHYVGGAQGTSTSSLYKSFGYGFYQILDNILTWEDSCGAHNWTVMLGQSTRWQFASSLTGVSYSVPDYDDAARYLSNGSYRNRNAYDGASRYHGVSAFTRVAYNYADKLLATFTFRADGSSKYQQKWGFFPSLGLGWNLTPNLKLRASWGMLGNDNVPANDIFIAGATGVAASAVFGEDNVVDGVSAQTVFKNALRWEVVSEWNVGLDMFFFRNRLHAEADYYHRVTDNVVFYAPVATGGGTATLLANNGQVLNQGVELVVGWSDKVGQLSYGANFNATFLDNRVLRLNGRDEIPGAAVNGVYSTSTRVGYPIGAFWGYRIDGVYASEKEGLKDPLQQTIKDAGFFKYHDLDGNGQINEDDRTYLGSPIPRLILGLNLSAAWRGWDFSLLMHAQVGNKILNAKRMQRSTFPEANYDLDFYQHRWTSENKSQTYPSAEALGTPFILQSNEFFVEDGSYLRIQQLQLGYSLRRIPGVKDLRLYVAAQRPLSLFRYHGFTTEIGGSPIESGIDNSVYPMQAIYTLGANLHF